MKKNTKDGKCERWKKKIKKWLFGYLLLEIRTY